ncbi:hypothetical protein C8F04DRAFT_1398141 [Mycena alexandri]|uniref:F-box domain-containing protein n=1 Tax=Mycena alexandri TaxID=1745969 RepID=A0AAD6SLB9_9AGAR|nr:hypothetical protein C8F04DRAFT_1398141 [Mycena alexandri]
MASATDTNSLVTTLLAENKRPTEAQEREIRQAIPRLKEVVVKTQKEFNDVDISLAIIPPDETPDAHLTEELARLTLELNSAKDQLANFISTISPQVPVEVLEVIFRMCLPQTDYIVPNSKNAPLVLCHICSAWRKVARMSPRLWCSLSLHLDRRPGAWKAFLESWLGSSGQLPLSLSIESDPEVQSYQYFNDHIVKLLLQAREALASPAARCPFLLAHETAQCLVSTPRAPGDEPTGPLLGRALLADPRAVGPVVHPVSWDPSYMHMPWDRLTHFHAASHPFPLEKCFPILAKCKNLTWCTIQISSRSVIPPAPQQSAPPLLQRLRGLVVIGAIYQDSVTLFLQQMKLQLPSLKTLELVNLRPGEPFFRPQSPILELGRRSNLRCLRLTGGWPLDGLFDAVVAIPSLREVHLERREGDYRATEPIQIPHAVQEALDMRITHTGFVNGFTVSTV